MPDNELIPDEIETRGSPVGALIKERRMADRLLDAMQVFRSDKSALTTLGVAHIQHKAKSDIAAPPDLGHYNPAPAYHNSYWWSRWHQKADFRKDVGDLHLNSLAMAVANFTSMRIPEAKPCVVRRNEQGDEERDFQHPAAQIIRRPNKHHTWPNYAGACSMSWWFNGNIHFYKTRDMTGQLQELWYLPYMLVRPRWPGDSGSPDVNTWAREHGEDVSTLDPFLSHYQYNIPGRAPVLYPKRDVLHLKRYLDLGNPRSGIGAFESLFKELGGDDSMATFTAAIFRNMGIQVPLISPADNESTIEETEAQHMKESWMAKTTGERAGEPIIMDSNIKVEKFGFSVDEMDVTNIRMGIEARVCAVCNISPAALQLMVGVQNGTSYASSEQARQQGYEEVIIPIQNMWAEEFTWQLLSEFKGSEGAEFQFDVSNVRVIQEDMDAKVAREVTVFKAGGSTYDEFLMAIGKKGVGGEIGKLRLIPSTSQPTNEEQLIAKADGSLRPEPVDPNAAAQSMLEEVEKTLAYLEAQNKEFMRGRQS